MTGAAEAFAHDIQGFPAFGLRNGALELTIVPALGAKLLSLRTGENREWMWHPGDARRLFRNSPGDAFARGTLCGADECLPTIAACDLPGRPLPDHGEVWTSPCRLDAAALQEGVLRTCLRLPFSPLRFERSIRLHDRDAVFEYELENLSDAPERYLWAFHPLLAVEPEDVIELPGGVRDVIVGASAGSIRLEPGSRVSWPETTPGQRLDRPGAGEDGFAKLFADFSGLDLGWGALRRGRERLVFEFDPAEVPYLGIWYTRRQWNGYTHMALEPTTAPVDSAAAWPGVIPPRAVRRWSFRLRHE